jgi:hypothetical protein
MVMTDIRVLIIAEEDSFSDSEPFLRNTAPGGRASGEFPVAQELCTEPARNACTCMFQIVTKQVRRRRKPGLGINS